MEKRVFAVEQQLKEIANDVSEIKAKLRISPNYQSTPSKKEKITKQIKKETQICTMM